MVRFVENFFLFNQLNVSRVDIPCVLLNGIGGAASSTQSVTLYITIHVTPPSLHNSTTVRGNSPAEEVVIPGRIQSPLSEHVPLSQHQPVESGSTMPQSREDVSHSSIKDPRLALLLADESIKRIVPIDGSNAWEKATERIKWVMDMLGPIAEVRATPLDCVLVRANLKTQLSPFAKMAHGLLLAIPKANPFLSFSE